MTKQRRIRVHVEGLEESGRRFVDAWRRAERGEPVHEEHLSFESLEGLLATLTPKRIELIRVVRRRPNLSHTAAAARLTAPQRLWTHRHRVDTNRGLSPNGATSCQSLHSPAWCASRFSS